MTECPTIPSVKYLFISDLHLDASSPKAIEAFIGFLTGAARSASAVYILGDLFEVWWGDDDLDPIRTRVCEALAELPRAGVQLYVMYGNRDFLYGESFTLRTGAKLLPDPVVATLFDKRILLTHGDLLCTDDKAYQELRSTVRTPAFRKDLLALPIEERQFLATAARASSKAHTSQIQTIIMDVAQEAVIAAFLASRTRLMVHGHTHRPAMHIHDVEGEPALRIVLDAWYEHGSVLELNTTGWARRELPFV